jgi:hypothetical protein
MNYLIVRTDVRPIADTPAAGAGTDGLRDERTRPENRRQTATAEDRDAAMRMARAFASAGPVRAGRQRVKVIRLDVG